MPVAEASTANSTPAIFFIEGDGRVWPNRFSPPTDPTPVRSLAKQLMRKTSELNETNKNIKSIEIYYTKRPCQYLSSKDLQTCPSRLWTQARYSEEAVAWMLNQIHNQQLEGTHQHIILVGHSGGGTMATLIGQRHPQVDCVVTMAAPLDTEAWTQLTGQDPLQASHNPRQGLARARRFKEYHFYGANDKTVPPGSIGFYGVIQQALEREPYVELVPNVGHAEGWLEHWPSILKKTCLKDYVYGHDANDPIKESTP